MLRENNFNWYNNIYYIKDVNLGIESSYTSSLAWNKTFSYPGVRNSFKSDIHDLQYFHFHNDSKSGFGPSRINDPWYPQHDKYVTLSAGRTAEEAKNAGWSIPYNLETQRLFSPVWNRNKDFKWINVFFGFMNRSLSVKSPNINDIVQNAKWIKQGKNGNYFIIFNAYAITQNDGFFEDRPNNIFIATLWNNWWLESTPIYIYRVFWEVELIKTPRVFEQDNVQWNEPVLPKETWVFSIDNKQANAYWSSSNGFKDKVIKDRKIMEAFTRNRQVTQSILNMGKNVVVKPLTDDEEQSLFSNKWDIFKYTPIIPVNAQRFGVDFYVEQHNADLKPPISFSQLSRLWLSQLQFDPNSVVDTLSKTFNEKDLFQKDQLQIMFKKEFTQAIAQISKLNEEIDLATDKATALQKFDSLKSKDSNVNFASLQYLYDLLGMEPTNKEHLIFIRNLPEMLQTIFARAKLLAKVKIGDTLQEITLLKNNVNVFDIKTWEKYLTPQQHASNEYTINFLSLDFIVDDYESENLHFQVVDQLFGAVKNLPTINKIPEGYQYKFKYRSNFSNQQFKEKDFSVPLHKAIKSFSVGELKQRMEKLNDFEKQQIVFVIKNSFAGVDKTVLDVDANSLTFVEDPRQYKLDLGNMNENKGFFYVLADIHNSNELFKLGSTIDPEIIKGQIYFVKQNQIKPNTRTYLFKINTRKLLLDKQKLWFKPHLETQTVSFMFDEFEIGKLDIETSNIQLIDDYEFEFQSDFSLQDEQVLLEKLNIVLSQMNLHVETKNARLNPVNKMAYLTVLKNNQKFNLEFHVDRYTSQLSIQAMLGSQRLFAINYDLKLSQNKQMLYLINKDGLEKSVWFNIKNDSQTKLAQQLARFLKENNFQFRQKPVFDFHTQNKAFALEKLDNKDDTD